MSKALTIVATIEAKPDKIDLVKAELKKLIAPTLKEEIGRASCRERV